MEHEYPKPASDEVTVKVKTCGICGTDLMSFQEGGPFPWATKYPDMCTKSEKT